jgi:methionyl-tRNA formyltransferase
MPSAAPVSPLVPSKLERPIRVAFFLNSDITSHIVVNRLLPILLRSGATVHVFLTHSQPHRNHPRRLWQLYFVEHVLLQEHAYPYVDNFGIPAPDHFNTPAGWRALLPPGSTVRDVKDVNDPEFVAGLADENLDISVSVRCYQKFRQPLIDTVSRPGSLFVNVHPGLLPFYRGVTTFARSMIDGAPRAGFTMHHVDAELDTGDVIGQASFPLSYSHSVLENMMAHATDSASLMLDLMHRVSAGQPVPARPQDNENAGYFSYLTDADLDRLAGKGVDLFQASAVIDVLTDAFFGTLVDIGGLRDTLIEAAREAGIAAEDSRDRRLMLSSAST